MLHQYKLVQCPHCNEYSYISMEARQNHCPRCRNHVPVHTLEGEIVFCVNEMQCLIHTRHYEHHGIQPDIRPTLKRSPTAYVLYLLRQRRTEAPQWLPLFSIISQCLIAGLSIEEVLDAINTLASEGFLEKRDEFLRVIPLK